MILPIYLYGSPVLRERAAEVDLSTADKAKIQAFFEDMHETMHEADGCGLAAPQVGVSERMLVVDGNELVENYPELKGFVRKMINPVVVSESSEMSEYSEGCLSIPSVDADIKRPKTITVRYFDENLEEKEEIFDNFAARMVQHEMDHLDGVMFTDKAAPIRRKILAKRLNNISRGLARTSYKSKVEKA
ncbi:MAG: peptide deformylase [Bacteroidales bacterium]|nr:peptide deformylase [Bacteroidales bacterium]